MFLNLTKTIRDNATAAASSQMHLKVIQVVIITAALLVAVLGWMQAAQMLMAPVLVAGLGETVRAGDLSLRVPVAEWIKGDHGHDPAEEPGEVTLGPLPNPAAAPQADYALPATGSQSGYAMPPAMMPGMPVEGQQRLRVELTLANTGGAMQTIGPEDFRVEAADGRVWVPLMTNTFRSSTLGAQEALDGVLFVDVDQDAENIALVWQRGGAQVRIPIGAAPAHTETH